MPVLKAFPLMLLRGTRLARERDRWQLRENRADIPAVISSHSFTESDWHVMAALSAALAATEGRHPTSADQLLG